MAQTGVDDIHSLLAALQLVFQLLYLQGERYWQNRADHTY